MPRLRGIIRSLTSLCSTLRTESLGHVVNAVQPIPLGKQDGGDGHLVDTESAVAAFAVEVHVLVVVVLMTVVAVA